MKSFTLRYLLILLLTLPVLTACKDDDGGEPNATRTELLTAQTWQGDAVFIAGTDVTDNPELLNSLPDIRTMTLNFNADGTYTGSFTQNGAQISDEGNWEFRENETVLHFDLMSEYRLRINELNSERLSLTTNVDYNNLTVPAEVRFLAQ